MAESDASSTPWDGMHWSDEGTQEWRDGLSDAEVDEWHDWQLKGEREEGERWTREQAAGIEQIERAESDPQPSAEPQAPSGRESSGPTVSFVDAAGNPLDAIVNDEPVRIQANVPRTPGVEPAATIEVAISGTRTSFIGREYGDTDSVTLRWTGNQTGPAIYKTDVLTIAGGGGGAGSVGGLGFEFATGGTGGFVTDDGDVIEIGFDGARSAVQVYTSVARLELALTMTAIGAANQMYVNVLINLRGLEAELAGAPDSPEKAALLEKVNDLRAGAEVGVALAQRAVAYVNLDVLDHQKLAVARLYGGWLGLFRPPTVSTDVGTASAIADLRHHDPREENRLVLMAQEEAKEEVRRIIWQGLAQATIAGYRLLAQSTGVAQIMTLAGTTEMGESATGLDKWMAFGDLVSQAAMTGAMVKWNHSTITSRPTARIPRTQPVRDTQAAGAAPTGTPVAPEAAGMLRAAGLDAQLVARKHDVAIQVRFTNPDAMIPRATGAAPKPMALKSKTLKSIDREIGAPANAQDGAVGLFEPKLPARGTRTDAEWAAVQERYNLRKGEWEGAIGNHQRKLVDKGEFQVSDGMMCDKNGTPIAGDYDLFEITYRDGTPVPTSVYDAVVGDLMAASNFRAAHGAHMRWDPKPFDEAYHLDMSGDLNTALSAIAKWKADRSIFQSIVVKHQPGQEGLITFAPNQPPIITYAGQAVGPKLAELGVTVPPAIAAWQSPFVRPALFLATTDQLVAGRFPEGEGWEWTHHFDWNAEAAWWTEQYNEIAGSAPMLQITGAVTYPLDGVQQAHVRAEPTAVAPASFIPWRSNSILLAAAGLVIGVVALGWILFNSFGTDSPIAAAPSPTPVLAAAATQAPTLEPSPTPTPSPTPGPTASPTPTPSPTSPATPTPSPTPTPTAVSLLPPDGTYFGNGRFESFDGNDAYATAWRLTLAGESVEIAQLLSPGGQVFQRAEGIADPSGVIVAVIDKADLCEVLFVRTDQTALANSMYVAYGPAGMTCPSPADFARVVGQLGGDPAALVAVREFYGWGPNVVTGLAQIPSWESPLALITGSTFAFGEFIRTSGDCPVADRYNALFEFDVLDGVLTMNQLPINHATQGTVTRTGLSEASFATAAEDQTYEGTITGTTVRGINHYSGGDCDDYYDFLLTLGRPLVAPPPAGTAPGFLELLDASSFEQQLQLVGGRRVHLVVGSLGDPDVTMLLPIRVILYVGDQMPWNTLIEGDPRQVCRGPTGCSIDAPGPVDPAWLAPGQYPLLLAFAADGSLIAAHAQNGLPPDGLPPPYVLPQ